MQDTIKDARRDAIHQRDHNGRQAYFGKGEMYTKPQNEHIRRETETGFESFLQLPRQTTRRIPNLSTVIFPSNTDFEAQRFNFLEKSSELEHFQALVLMSPKV